MSETARRLRDVIERVSPQLLAISETQAARPPRPGKWSPKQVLGHLVDSASNNHQRFVRAQFTDDLVFPGYEQEQWVEVQRYQESSWESLVALWRHFNLHLAQVIDSVPDEVRLRPRVRHNLDQIAFTTVPTDQPATLEYFMNDYVDHLEHHLKQILV